MTNFQKIILGLSFSVLISFLVYAIIKDEARMKKYNIVIYQDSHRYRTDQFLSENSK